MFHAFAQRLTIHPISRKLIDYVRDPRQQTIYIVAPKKDILDAYRLLRKEFGEMCGTSLNGWFLLYAWMRLQGLVPRSRHSHQCLMEAEADATGRWRK